MQDFTIYSWYCPNCQTKVTGPKSKRNQIRGKCRVCGAEMVRTIKGRRHELIDIYMPDSMAGY